MIPTAIVRVARAETVASPRALRDRIAAWVRSRFGESVLTNRQERAARILEEAHELAQAEGVPFMQVVLISQRTYSRPVGDPDNEAAGVRLTLEGWGVAADRDVDELARREMDRLEKLDPEVSRRKHADKARAGTAMPGAFKP